MKFLVFKLFIAGLAFLGIYNHPMTDIFAQIENICINGKPMIAQEICEKNFNTIQEAVNYIESEVSPETDTIYNAQHYSILTSILREYCGPEIDRDILKKQRTLFKSINKIKDSTTKILYLKKIYDIWYNKSKETIWTWENIFCSQKYEAYNMLDMSKKAFIKELKKKRLLDASAISWTNKKDSDLFILSSFYTWSSKEDKSDIEYTLPSYKDSKLNQELANITKNISIKAIEDAINLLLKNNVLSSKDVDLIEKHLEIIFVPWCDKNTWYHKINQYLNEKDEITEVSLEEIKLNINLCKSYQYIDELSTNVSKLLIHEIWHYVYTFKDKTLANFEDICRSNQLNKCNSAGFVTKYSQTNPEEDYSETFSRRALAQLKNDKRYISFYSTFSALPQFNLVWTTHWSAIENILYQKFSYFDKLISKSSKTLSLK